MTCLTTQYGRKALGYLVGEKFLNYIRAADSDPSWEANVPKFAAEIRQIFTDEELQAYFATATRIGAGHVCTEEQYETTFCRKVPWHCDLTHVPLSY